MQRDAFAAIADPTRRAILGALAAEGALNLAAVADRFAISRPAVAKHIRLLTECGLIVVRPEGRERMCEARPEGLAEVALWIEQYRAFWNARFSALDAILSAQSKKKPAKQPRP